MSFPAQFLYIDIHPTGNSVDIEESLGPCPHGNTAMDPASQITQGSGLALNGANYEPQFGFRRIKILGGAAGQNVILKIQFLNGEWDTHNIVVPANDEVLLPGQFAGIYNTGSTFAAGTVTPYL